MDIKDYAQMMGYLTRPRDMVPDPSTMDQEPRIPFAKGSIKATRDYLDSLEEGATINRKNILKKFKVDNSVLSKIFKAYEDKNFNFEKSPSILKGVIKNQPTERQSYLGKYLYNKDWKNLTDQERTNIVNKGFNENTITDYRKSVIDKPLIQRAKDLGYKTNFKDMGYEDVRRVRAGLPPGNRLMNNKEKIRVDKEMLKLADDPRMVEIIKRGTPNKNDLLIVKELLGEGVNAPNKLNQFVAAFSGDRPVDGITLKFKDNAKNILDKMTYTNYQRAMDETQTGRQFGENSLSVIKKDIKKSPLYQDTGLSKFTNIDEANAITGNSRLGTSPYGIFGQIIDKEKNSGTKMAWDGRKSTLEKELQEAIALPDTDKTKKTKINQAVIKFNKEATKAEGKLNMQKLRGAKRIRLPRVSLDDPSKTIANWSKFNDKYKDVFNKNFVDRKYSFVIPKDLRTIPELRKDVLNPKSPVYKEMINTLKQGFNEFDEKKLFKKMNNATPESLKKIMRNIPRFASVDSNFETNMFASADNIMSDATYVDETEPNFIKRNPVVSSTAAATAGTAALAGSKLTKSDKLKNIRQGLKKGVGNIFKAGGLPMSLAFNKIYGIDLESSVDRTILGAEAALAPMVVKDAISVTDKIKNPLLKKAAQIATTINPKYALKAAKVLNPIGIASLAGEAVYNVGKLGYEDQKRFNALSPEEQAAERAEQEKFAFDVEGS